MSIELQHSVIFQFNKMTGTLPDIDNEKLAAELLASTRRLSDDPRMSTFEDMHVDLENGGESNKLFEAMRSVGESIGCCIDNEVWHQIHHKYESTDTHTHVARDKDLVLAWCYYVAAEANSGDLVFMIADTADGGAVLSSHSPVVGQFVIFPSFIKHKVSKNMSDSLRICVAGNFIPFGGLGAYR